MSTNTDGSNDMSTGGTRAEQDVSRRNLMKLTGAGAAAIGLSGAVGLAGAEQAFAAPTAPRKDLEPGDTSNGADNSYTSDRVTVRKISFKNQYDMKVVGNLFVPNDLDRRTSNPALVVGHPMGAVKEQSANLYATKMAEQGYVTLSLLPEHNDASHAGHQRQIHELLPVCGPGNHLPASAAVHHW